MKRKLPSRTALALALAALLTAPASPAAQRHWTFIGGCSSADWISLTTGFNAQGMLTC